MLADFGISTYVPARPGQKSFTYKEGTPYFMSPQMASLCRSENERIDLFYNDLWGLKRTIEAIEDKVSGSKSTELSEEIELYKINLQIKLLADVLNNQSISLNSDMGAFTNYFKQLNDKVIEGDYNLEFLIRCIGLNTFLVPYLKSTRRPSYQGNLLLQKLSNQADDAIPLLGIEQAGTIELLRKYYLRCLRKLARVPDP